MTFYELLATVAALIVILAAVLTVDWRLFTDQPEPPRVTPYPPEPTRGYPADGSERQRLSGFIEIQRDRSRRGALVAEKS
jgi:hypothetical protein